jgi:5-bromo-4-chloroindolyl phosphate hydrolysis protein
MEAECFSETSATQLTSRGYKNPRVQLRSILNSRENLKSLGKLNKNKNKLTNIPNEIKKIKTSHDIYIHVIKSTISFPSVSRYHT